MVFVFSPLQSGANVTWRGMRMSSFAGSTLYSTMISRWSSLELQETALRLKESKYNILSFYLEWSWKFSPRPVSHQCVPPVRVLSKDSPSGDMKAVVRECKIKAEDKQFLEVCGHPSHSHSHPLC